MTPTFPDVLKTYAPNKRGPGRCQQTAWDPPELSQPQSTPALAPVSTADKVTFIR